MLDLDRRDDDLAMVRDHLLEPALGLFGDGSASSSSGFERRMLPELLRFADGFRRVRGINRVERLLWDHRPGRDCAEGQDRPARKLRELGYEARLATFGSTLTLCIR